MSALDVVHLPGRLDGTARAVVPAVVLAVRMPGLWRDGHLPVACS